MKVFHVIILTLLSFFCFGQIPAPPPISLSDFLVQNINVVAVTSEGGILNINGYSGNNFLSTRVLLTPTQVLAISKSSFRPHLSLVTIPFKVRSSIDTIPQNVQTGLTNAGIGLNIYNYKLTRYFSSGNKSTHLFGFGFIFAPAAEELSPDNTRKYVNKKSKQLFVSTGVSFAYTYNDLTFMLIPAGFDFATTTDGRNYIYNKKRWWGLGIGISTKLFGLF